ncbi:MAG: GNAT family N-acetyltransferase [Candidatus Hodarchaeales archaeon]|jgi:RimJ/RimL family protein N-acetyltransferase
MLIGKLVTLRGLEYIDVGELQKFWNTKEFMNFNGRINPFSNEECKKWIHNTWEERSQGKAFAFAIISNDNNRIIGNLRLRILNHISRRADLSIGIFNPSYRGKRLGTESLKLLINFGFNTLNLFSIELKVFSNNQIAIACCERLGFKKKGLRRKADFVEGQFLDDLMMDLLSEEWKY